MRLCPGTWAGLSGLGEHDEGLAAIAAGPGGPLRRPGPGDRDRDQVPCRGGLGLQRGRVSWVTGPSPADPARPRTVITGLISRRCSPGRYMPRPFLIQIDRICATFQVSPCWSYCDT